jgi:uncharacterized 2Fe-2S/4Fe-4S cluster protein (DUF4445 family)
MARHRVTFLPSEKIFYLDDEDTLLDAAMKAGVYINASCGGNSSCGKCRIKVIEGSVVSSRHPKITRTDYDKGYRLACKSRPQGNVVVEVPLESQIDRSLLKGKSRKPLILSASDLGQLVKKWKADPSFFKVYIDLPVPTADDNISDFGRLARELRNVLKKDNFLADLKVMRKMIGIFREAAWKITVTLTARNDGYQILNIEPGNKAQQNYSIVIDIGTTTVSGQILDLANCSQDICTLGESSDYNAQVRYGDDVISRIMYSRKKGGLARLQEAVVSTINGIIGDLVDESRVEKTSISHLVFAGNTTMAHLFLGLDPANIMLSPYTPASNIYPSVVARDIGVDTEDYVYAQVFPCVSSYIGGDIIAGVIGSGMSRSDKVTLFIDIGTNGEIVFGNRDWLICASCSAGPAFEGAGIQFGMRAENGAIEQVRINPVNYEPMIITVGKAKPKGICGSGLIDSVAELFSTGILDQNGKFRRDLATSRVREGESGHEYVMAYKDDTQIHQDIVLTEVDLDNLIRAKAALYAGCKVLIDSVGLTFRDIEKVIIAGGFGHYIDLEKAQTIGLLPELPLERFVFVGNGSLLGARLFSFSKGFMAEAENISKMMTNVELSNSQKFMDEFVAASFLPHTDGKAFPRTMKRINEGSFVKAMRQAIEKSETDGK